jgi:hypothetical protein
MGACGSVIRRGTILQAGRSRDRVPMRWMFFNLPNPSSRTMALGSTQALTEMSTRNFPGSKGRPARGADNLTAIVSRLSRQNVGASTSHNPMGLHGLLHGYLYLYIYKIQCNGDMKSSEMSKFRVTIATNCREFGRCANNLHIRSRTSE